MGLLGRVAIVLGLDLLRDGYGNELKCQWLLHHCTSCKLFCESLRCCSSCRWRIPSSLGRWFSELENTWRRGVFSKPWEGEGGELREREGS